MRNGTWDAVCLRDTAGILQARARRRTFMLRVVTRFLERAARQAEQEADA